MAIGFEMRNQWLDYLRMASKKRMKELHIFHRGPFGSSVRARTSHSPTSSATGTYRESM